MRRQLRLQWKRLEVHVGSDVLASVMSLRAVTSRCCTLQGVRLGARSDLNVGRPSISRRLSASRTEVAHSLGIVARETEVAALECVPPLVSCHIGTITVSRVKSKEFAQISWRFGAPGLLDRAASRATKASL